PPTAPSAPVLLPSTTGNPEDNVTTSTTPSFYGTTTGSITTVTIYSDGLQVGSGSASNYANNTVGVSVTTPLSVGTHVITAKATDAIGAVSAASSPLSITVINTIKQATIGTANSGNSTTTTLCHTGTGNSTTPSSGITATTCTGTPATTSQADELLVGAVGMDSKQGNLTAGNSFTSLTNSQDGGSASNPLQLQPAYLVVDAAGQYAATWTY